MREVHVRRHAPKVAAGDLTEAGKEKARQLQTELGTFDVIVASTKPRAIETALLLTGKDPVTDTRAAPAAFTPEQERQLHILGEKHPFGIAGVIFDIPEYRTMIMAQGKQLAALVSETMEKLTDGQRALIISHDGVMVAAEKVLKDLSSETAGQTFGPLEGFRVNDRCEITELRIVETKK